MPKPQAKAELISWSAEFMPAFKAGFYLYLKNGLKNNKAKSPRPVGFLAVVDLITDCDHLALISATLLLRH